MKDYERCSEKRLREEHKLTGNQPLRSVLYLSEFTTGKKTHFFKRQKKLRILFLYCTDYLQYIATTVTTWYQLFRLTIQILYKKKERKIQPL